MPYVTLPDVTLYYEMVGEGGPLVALMPGGRSDHRRLAELARLIAARGYRVLSLDRRNCGFSDVRIEGDAPEYELWADDLSGVLRELGVASAFIAGTSSGCRTAIVFALKYPEMVRGLMLLRITGGPFAAHHLAHEYYGQFIDVARRGGMEAVCNAEHFRDRVAERPQNRTYLLGLGADRFIRQMEHWQEFYLRGADLPMIGATAEQLRSIAAPALVIAGNDRTHPRELAFNLEQLLPDVEVHDVIGPQQDIVRTPAEAWDAKNEEIAAMFAAFMERVTARSAGGVRP